MERTKTQNQTRRHAAAGAWRRAAMAAMPGALLLAVLLTACEKDLDIDYHQVAPLYVVEAAVTHQRTTVHITTTHDMDDNETTGGVENATVVISSGDSLRVTAKYTRNGYYTASLKGQPGTRYTVDIDVDGRHFSSSSTMQPMPVVNSFRFVWKKFATERYLLADLKLQDIPGATNYYFMHIYRNGVGYRWAVTTDKQRDAGGELQQLFTCVSQRDMDKGSGGDVLLEGDVIRVDVRAIDKAAYDYLYSMQLMESTGTNPIANFTGGCLGYFSAYSQLSYEYTFHRDGIEEE